MVLKTIFIFFILLIGCRTQDPIPKNVSQDEYDVYSAVINRISNHSKEIEGKSDSQEIVFIHNKTTRGWLIGERDYSKFSPKTSKSDTGGSLKHYSNSSNWNLLVNNFRIVQYDTLPLSKEKFSTISKVSIHNLMNGDRVPRERKWIGNYYFSRVGFNSDTSEALVMCSFYGFESGGEYSILLRKENRRWKVINGYGLHLGWFNEYDFLFGEPMRKSTRGNPVPVPEAELKAPYINKPSVP